MKHVCALEMHSEYGTMRDVTHLLQTCIDNDDIRTKSMEKKAEWKRF